MTHPPGTTSHQTEIIVDRDVPLARIIRELDAPPERVFRAHADPSVWSGGEGFEAGSCGAFHEVRPAEPIVQTFTFEGEPDGVALDRLVVEDIDGGRTRLTATSLVDSFAGRAAFVASGMDTGIRECYERLDALLAG